MDIIIILEFCSALLIWLWHANESSCCAQLLDYASCGHEGLAPIYVTSCVYGELLHSADVYIQHFYLQLVFEGIRGRNYRGDAAIDDVMIYDC